MEEKKKKRQEDKAKKDTAQKKVAEQQKAKVPDSARAPPPSAPSPPHATSSSSDGRRSPPSPQQALQCPPRYPPREVPPRFRHHEHRQLLRRGQPPPPTALSQSTGAGSPPRTPTSEHLAVLPHQRDLGAKHENSLWIVPTSRNQVITEENNTETWPSFSYSNSQQALECTLDTDTSELVSSSMSMATGASQQGHYQINKTSINHSSTMVSSQGGPNRGWASESKTDLSMASRSHSSWGTSNLNLNPSANPAAWPVLGHEAPGVGSGPGVMGGSSSLPSNMCGPGGVAPVHSTNGNGNIGCANGNLVGDCAWGTPDTPEQHQSPTNMSFSMDPPNLKTDGPNTKAEPMSPAHSWGGTLSQSPTEQAGGDGTSLWSGGDMKGGVSKDSGWDSGGMSSWGPGGGGAGWGNWSKQSSSEGIGWDGNDGAAREPMSSWGNDAPASDSSRDSSEGLSRRRESSSSVEFPLLPRQDLDPRVLCNSGWGQTPVRQHTVWEMDENPDIKDDGGTEAWGSSCNAPLTGPAPPPQGCANPSLSASPRMDSGSKSETPSRTMSAPGWAGSVPPTSQPSTGWGEPTANKKVPNGSVGSWGEPMPDGPSTNGSSGQSWGSEDKSPSWDDGSIQAKSQGWGDGPSTSSGWGSSGSGNSGEWGETSDGRKSGSGSSSWDGEGGNWKEPQKGWGKAAPAAGGGTWGDSQHSNGTLQGWGAKPQESSSGNSDVGSMGSWGGPSSVKQGGSAWGSVARPDPGEEATGWEEPSPSSIRRKMEIDDGTSTWGDPNAYRTCVNMWDRNNPASHNNPGTSNNGSSNNHHTGPSNNNHHHSHHGQGPSQNHSNVNNNGSPNQLGPPHNRIPMVNPGWGELPSVQPKSESSTWGEPTSSSPPVDNGTAAWGKPARGIGGWPESHEPSAAYGRSSAPTGSGSCKPGPKSMQDGWGSGGEEMSMSSSQWDAEDGDMWTSPTSQDSGSSCTSWNQSKKGIQKGKVSTKQDEVWIMNRLIKQLTDMGFPRDPAEEALRSNNMNLDQAMSALLEKKSEGDRRGMGVADYSSGLNKPLVGRPPSLSKDSALDRASFLDKDGGLSDDTPTSPFMPSPAHKLPLTNSSLPSHGLGGISSALAMQNLNNRQMNGMFGSNGAAQARALQQQVPPPQPPVPPLSSAQPTLRAQVPQFLSPQVQAQLLQFAAKNIGLSPALLSSPINPQQMTLLYQLQQLQMAYQRLQIQQQMMQAQRNVSGPIRQQEQQVARTISNMQQQIQQHQRQLAQALLMKQHQASPASSHTGLHASHSKPNLDMFPVHPQASGLSISDLQNKEPQTPHSSFGPYPLSGMNGNVAVGCMEVGGVALKEAPPQPQSRLSQWTHAGGVDALSTSSPHMENSLSKHSRTAARPHRTASSTHVGDGKVIEDSFSPYSLLSSSQSPSSPMVAPESWAQGKSPSEKISNGTSISWPPEFCPGVPWKGLQNIDPEADPNMTPGSVSSGPTINTTIQDVNRYLLRDRNGGKLLDMKSTWSAGPVSHTQASLSHELWKVPSGGRTSMAPSRPPPGLTNTKPSPSWASGSLGLGQGWSTSYSSEGTAWSSDSSSRTSSWLVLRNLTPQIDGSTLRTLCMQHGPLITFHLSLPQGNALVRYSSKEEAAKAQKSLHMCVLGNTTILAEFAGEEEVTRFFAQGQSLPPSNSWQGSSTPGSSQPRLANPSTAHPAVGHWGGAGTKAAGNSGGGGGSGAELLWGGVQQYSSLWGPANGEESRVMGSPIPINTLLPGDLLSGEGM
ncbi:trinucleotide repeat-containing gene 6C protein isoform X2 [Electrophorus electricus]|uniref:trinucleotide repeat-containing gene 6C protein isoform X2 n=1 Tax=Electrophorus electricus TaxID=8005 RepID=UPI0015CFB802|nr:trinucleotide repeat-containing gene 6C protein isoform X2 [Electrophorus electricus]